MALTTICNISQCRGRGGQNISDLSSNSFLPLSPISALLIMESECGDWLVRDGILGKRFCHAGKVGRLDSLSLGAE